MRFDYHKNNQELGTPLNTNNQDTSSYVLDAKQSFSADAALSATAFYSESTFVTNNPTVNDSTLPPSEQTEHTDNIHTTPFHNVGGSLVWSQDLHSFFGAFTAGVDANDVKGSDSAAIFDSTGTTQIRTDVGRGEQLFLARSCNNPSCRCRIWRFWRVGESNTSRSSMATTAIRVVRVRSPIRTSRSLIPE